MTEIIASILDEYSLVKFVPLNSEDDEEVTNVLLTIDNCIQYGEDLDVQDRLPDEADPIDAGYSDT